MYTIIIAKLPAILLFLFVGAPTIGLLSVVGFALLYCLSGKDDAIRSSGGLRGAISRFMKWFRCFFKWQIIDGIHHDGGLRFYADCYLELGKVGILFCVPLTLLIGPTLALIYGLHWSIVLALVIGLPVGIILVIGLMDLFGIFGGGKGKP